jgi:hypothetical protein
MVFGVTKSCPTADAVTQAGVPPAKTRGAGVTPKCTDSKLTHFIEETQWKALKDQKKQWKTQSKDK